MSFLLLIGFLASPVFAGGQAEEEGKEASAEEEVVTIDYWAKQESSKTQARIEKALQRFEDMHENINIETNIIPYPQYRDKLTVAIEGGDAPDLFIVDQIWNAEFAASGAIIPLDDYVAESDISADKFFDGAWDSVLWNDQIWGIPLDLDVWSFTFFNKDLFRQAGIDADNPPLGTADGFLEVSEKVNQLSEDQWALALPGGKSEGTVVVITKFIYSFGGQIVSADGTESRLDSPATIRALKYYKQLEQYAPVGVAASVREDNLQMFKNGKVAMFFFPQLGQDSLDDVGFDWSVGLNPAPEGNEHIGVLGGWNLVVSSDSKVKDEAFELIEYLTSQEINTGLTSLVPANIEAADEYIETRKQPELTMEHLMRAKPRPISPIYPQISEALQDMVQEIFSGDSSIEEAVAETDAEIQKLLDRLNQ
jgi:ABC-type glycerol-3-phosphate transport system substrate-binding protein